MRSTPTANEVLIREFLAGGRFALIGVSDDPKSFSRTVYNELRAHGYEVVAVNHNASTVEGATCYPDLASVPGSIDGVIAMVGLDRSPQVVRECVERGVPRVWLFKGLGGPGAAGDEVVALCAENGLPVVAGACPLMFLQPVGWFHRIHRAGRRARGALVST